MKIRLFALFLLIASSLPIARAAEVITNFASQIEIKRNGVIVVTETIQVQVEGVEIKRGIYRDLPTIFQGPLSLRQEVPFHVLSVRRDGRDEPWRTELRSNGIRIYIGDANVLLPHVPTTYTIKYQSSGQLGFFPDFDELYWNVTGNGWIFPILKASVCVVLPPGAPVRSAEAYTGQQGEKNTAFRAVDKPNCDVALATVAALSPGDGFTIAVTWPKGFVVQPTPTEQLKALVKSNSGLAIGLVGLVIAAAYFVFAWIAVGRDPDRGTIIPLYAPPEGMSPQDVRYVNTLGTCDQTSFAAAVMDLAAKRSLTIKKNTAGNYVLTKGPYTDDGPLASAIFKDGSPLELVSRNHQTVQSARNELLKLVKAANSKLFSKNTSFWFIGLLITLIPLAVSILSAKETATALFLLFWLSIWSVGCAAIATQILSYWRSGKVLAAIPLTLFGLPFFAGWIFGCFFLVMASSLWVCGIYVAGITLCIVFQYLLKRPTAEGQKIRDEIAGFRRYLAVAEADRLNLEHPPERTPELFEKFLPYALALGVDQQWSQQFRDVFASINTPESPASTLDSSFTSRAAFATGMGTALVSAISSASTAPGSTSGSSGSSGSGGGGSSGGGGGGGGGGGW